MPMYTQYVSHTKGQAPQVPIVPLRILIKGGVYDLETMKILCGQLNSQCTTCRRFNYIDALVIPRAKVYDILYSTQKKQILIRFVHTQFSFHL